MILNIYFHVCSRTFKCSIATYSALLYNNIGFDSVHIYTGLNVNISYIYYKN